MAETANEEQRWLRTLTVAASVLTGGLGIAALVGWITGVEGLTTFGAGRIPMAPSTALLLLLFATLLLLKPLARSDRSAQVAGWVGGAVGTTLALALLILSALGIVVKAEHLGLSISGAVAGAPVGHMSPVTAICFILAGLAYLFMQVRRPNAAHWGRAALGFALVLLLVSAVLTAAYLLGAPLLYDSGAIPPALTTSLGFLALSGALLAHIGQGLRGYEQAARANTPRPPYALFAIAAILGLAIIGAAYIYFRSYQAQFRREVESELTAVAELKIGEIVHWRSERLGDGIVFYENPNFAGLVAQVLNDPNDSEAKARMRVWLDKVRTAHHYQQVTLVDAQGMARIASPPGASSPAHLNEMTRAVLRSQEVTLIDFHRHAPDDAIVLSVLTPILDSAGTGNALGALVLEIG